MRRSRKLCQRESNSDNVFLVDEGREDQNNTKSGPSSSLVFQGIGTRIAKKPFIFVIYQEEGGVRPPVPHSGFMHEINTADTVQLSLFMEMN